MGSPDTPDTPAAPDAAPYETPRFAAAYLRYAATAEDRAIDRAKLERVFLSLA